MAMISTREIEKIQADKARDQRTIENLREGKKKKGLAETGLAVLEAAGAAGVVGFIRGTVEKSGKPFSIPGTPIDIEALTALGLVGSAAFGAWGRRYNDHVLHAGLGVLGHYTGQVARGLGAGKPFSPVVGMLPAYTGMEQRAFAQAPFVGQDADSELAQALANAGV